MRHLEIKKGDLSVEVTIPETMNELSSEQVFYLADMWRSWQWMLQSDLDMQKARAILFTVLLNARSTLQKAKALRLLGEIDYLQLGWFPTDLVDFVFKQNQLTINPLRSFGIFRKFYGPADMLKNINIFEFSHALHFYNRYNKTEDRSELDMLVACLYRPKARNWEPTGDIRQSFNPNTADKYVQRISRVRYRKKEAVFLFFAGVMQSWAKAFPLVFQKADPKDTPKAGTFVDVVLAMSGGKFGTYDETQRINAYTFLKELNSNMVEALKKTKK